MSARSAFIATDYGCGHSVSRAEQNVPAMAADPTHGLLLFAQREYRVLDGEKSWSGGLGIYDYRQNKNRLFQIHEGLPSNDVTAVAMDGTVAWVGGRGFVAVVDVQERKVLRILRQCVDRRVPHRPSSDRVRCSIELRRPWVGYKIGISALPAELAKKFGTGCD